jgi:hypothetical protein
VLQPVVSNITLATNVPGLTVFWDGSPFTSNFTFPSIVGRVWSIGAQQTQVLGGQTYEFQNWSDGGALTHDITVPNGDTTFTATYLDVTAPQAASSAFIFDEPAPQPPHQVRFSFSENVSASLSTADITVRRLSDTSNVATSSIALIYRADTNTAIFHFPGTSVPGVLPDGNYRATLSGAGVTDAFGNPLSGGDVVVDFFIFAGDANHDRNVNINDFAFMAANFNQPGTFSQGDFNYSGTTDIQDFAILASKFNTSLDKARFASSPSPLAASRVERFSASPIDRDSIFDDERSEALPA